MKTQTEKPKQPTSKRQSKKQQKEENNVIDTYVTLLVEDSETYHRNFRNWQAF